MTPAAGNPLLAPGGGGGGGGGGEVSGILRSRRCSVPPRRPRRQPPTVPPPDVAPPDSRADPARRPTPAAVVAPADSVPVAGTPDSGDRHRAGSGGGSGGGSGAASGPGTGPGSGPGIGWRRTGRFRAASRSGPTAPSFSRSRPRSFEAQTLRVTFYVRADGRVARVETDPKIDDGDFARKFTEARRDVSLQARTRTPTASRVAGEMHDDLHAPSKD